MSPNTNSSEEKSPTLVNERKSDNNSSDKNQQNLGNLHNKIDPTLKNIVITKHLCEPCPGVYTDILKTLYIVCKDPNHSFIDGLIDPQRENLERKSDDILRKKEVI